MSSSVRTKAVILRRTNYGEADRILQLLTPEYGKISVIAKGVRREKSKLAGGIELFAISDISFRTGRSELGTLTGAKLDTYFAHIIEDYDRMQLGYEAIKQINKAAETVSETAFYELLVRTYRALDDKKIRVELVEIWFRLQLSILLGLGLNLATDVNGMKLVEDSAYDFDEVEMAFTYKPGGRFTTDHIKLLRLLSGNNPRIAAQVKGIDGLLDDCLWLVRRAFAH